MTNRLDDEDRGILEFRPNIEFVEPDQQPGELDPVEIPVQLEDVQEARAQIKKLAEAVNTLATAIQTRVDQRADGMYIDLDGDVDQDTIQAMQRRFPNSDPTRITYAQYRDCKNGIRAKGEEIGMQGIVTHEQVQDIRDSLRAGTGSSSSLSGFVPGGIRDKGADSGALRPELNSAGYVLPPLNVSKMQVDLICILVNYIWKEYIKKLIGQLPLVGAAAIALPDQICDPGFDPNIPGLYVLGEDPDPLLTGELAAEKAGNATQELAKSGVQGGVGNV